jgi:perosamine synthetase
VLGLSQMMRLDEMINKREQVACMYNERLAEIPGVEIPFVEQFTSRMSWFVYVIRLAATFDRDKIAGELERCGIPVRPYFLPIHLQPYMVERFGYHTGDFPVTEGLGQKGLALPFSGVMNEEQVETVCRSIRLVLQGG